MFSRPTYMISWIFNTYQSIELELFKNCSIYYPYVLYYKKRCEEGARLSNKAEIGKSAANSLSCEKTKPILWPYEGRENIEGLNLGNYYCKNIDRFVCGVNCIDRN